MASQNQALALTAVYQQANSWVNPGYGARMSFQMTAQAAGSAATSGKFIAWTNSVVYGATFSTVALATSTYTVNGTATTSCQALYAVFVTNTSTTATAALSTTTLGAAATGPFFVSGTGTPGTNVSVLGQGGLGGYYRYALNTLGGTNTSMPWGTVTYNSVTTAPFGAQGGFGGLYMNPGDTLQFINGTDATGSVTPIVEYSIATPQSGTGAIENNSYVIG
jgi:hypothetical protein